MSKKLQTRITEQIARIKKLDALNAPKIILANEWRIFWQLKSLQLTSPRVWAIKVPRPSLGPYLQLSTHAAEKLIDTSLYSPGLPFWLNTDSGVVIQAPAVHDDGRRITLAELRLVEQVEAGCLRCKADLLRLLQEVAEGRATVLWFGAPPSLDSFIR